MSGILNSKRILVVDDEQTIAMLIGEALLDEGAVVVGPAGDLDAALALARESAIDAAILDVNLFRTALRKVVEVLLDAAGKWDREQSVGDLLAARGIPYVFATGYGDRSIGGLHADAPVIAKPFQLDAMVAAIERLLA